MNPTDIPHNHMCGVCGLDFDEIAEKPTAQTSMNPTARETEEKKTTGMKMAKAPYEEWEKVMEFVNELDALSGDWQASDEKVGKYVRRFMPPMLRVCYGYRVLFDNCCDPNADTLEFKPELFEQKRKVSELTAALARSEEEKNKSDTFREELRARFNELKDRYDLLQSSLSTLTARLKEAEKAMRVCYDVLQTADSRIRSDETEYIVEGHQMYKAINVCRSFLTASTTAEKE